MVEEAADIAPSAPRVLKYRVMVILANLVQRANVHDSAGAAVLRCCGAAALTQALKDAIDKVAEALGPDDLWVRHASTMANSIGAKR
jgi:hypothetical protein